MSTLFPRKLPKMHRLIVDELGMYLNERLSTESERQRQRLIIEFICVMLRMAHYTTKERSEVGTALYGLWQDHKEGEFEDLLSCTLIDITT